MRPLLVLPLAALLLAAGLPALPAGALHGDHAQQSLGASCAQSPVFVIPACRVDIRHDVYRNDVNGCTGLGCWVHQDCHGTAEAQGDALWAATFTCTNRATATATCPADNDERLEGRCMRDFRTYAGAGIHVDRGTGVDFFLSGSVTGPLTLGHADTGASRIRACVDALDQELHIFVVENQVGCPPG